METLRATEIYSNPAIRVIAIESISCNLEKSGGFCGLYASIEPTAMIVCRADENHVVNLASVETSLEELKLKVPGLRSLLGETRNK